MCQANASGPYAPRSSRTAGSPIGSCEVSTGTPPIQQVREVARERDRCILIGSVEGPAPTPGEGHPRAPCATHDAPKAHGAHLSKEGARKQPITARGQVPLDAVEAEIPLGHVLRDRTNQHHPTRTRIATNIRHPTSDHQAPTGHDIRALQQWKCVRARGEEHANRSSPLGRRRPTTRARPRRGGIGGKGQPAAAARCRPPLLCSPLEVGRGEGGEPGEEVNRHEATVSRQRLLYLPTAATLPASR
jgi:hypothetical protein